MANQPPTQPAPSEGGSRDVESTPVDELLTQAAGPTDRAEEFFHKNWKLIALAFGGALLLVIVVISIRGYQTYQARLAAEAFTGATTIDQFETVVQNHPGTLAAGNALLRKADLLWQEGESDRSIATLEQFLRDHETHPLRPQTLISLGSRQEDMDRPGAAEGHYRRVVDDFADTPYAPMAQLRLAEIKLADGDAEAGRQLLEQMPSTFPSYGPSFVPLAEERLRQLEAGLPTQPIPPPADAQPSAPEDVPPFMPDGPGLIPETTTEDPITPGLPPIPETETPLPDDPLTPDPATDPTSDGEGPEQPATGAGTPMEDTEAPAEEPGTPAEDTEAPTEETGEAADEAETVSEPSEQPDQSSLPEVPVLPETPILPEPAPGEEVPAPPEPAESPEQGQPSGSETAS